MLPPPLAETVEGALALVRGEIGPAEEFADARLGVPRELTRALVASAIGWEFVAKGALCELLARAGVPAARANELLALSLACRGRDLDVAEFARTAGIGESEAGVSASASAGGGLDGGAGLADDDDADAEDGADDDAGGADAPPSAMAVVRALQNLTNMSATDHESAGIVCAAMRVRGLRAKAIGELCELATTARADADDDGGVSVLLSLIHI